MTRTKRMPEAHREAVGERSGGTCEGCGDAPATNVHHRKYLSRGGTHEVTNLLALCGQGNASGCHGKAHTGAGETLGWSVPSWAHSELWPVYRRGEWVRLIDDTIDKITESTAALLMDGVS